MKPSTKLFTRRSLLRPGIASALYAASLIAFSLSMARVLDTVGKREFDLIPQGIGLSVLLLAIQGMMYFFHTRAENRWMRERNSEVKETVICGWNRQRYEEFTSEDTAEHVSFFVKELDLLENEYFRSILALLSCIPILVISLASLWAIHSAFIGLLAGMVIVSLLVTILFSEKMETANAEFLDRVKSLNQIVEENCRGFALIKIFSLQNVIQKTAQERIHKQETKGEYRQNLSQTANGLIMIVTLGVHVAAYAIGAWLILNGQITLGLMIASVEIIGYAFEPVVGIAGAITRIKSCRSIVENVRNIMGTKPQVAGRELSEQKIPIHVRELRFTYPGACHATFSDLHFHLEPGKTYALSGRNGSGKSTLLKVLAGLYDCYEGRIEIGGHDEKEIRKDALFERVAYIPQDAFVFTGGARENMAAADESAVRPLLERFRIEYAKDRVWGQTMSGGERQKISIIRALIKDADLVLADEPTSQLDPHAKEIFYQLMKSSKKTWVVITHDPEELSHFDEVIPMTNAEREKKIA